MYLVIYNIAIYIATYVATCHSLYHIAQNIGGFGKSTWDSPKFYTANVSH